MTAKVDAASRAAVVQFLRKLKSSNPMAYNGLVENIVARPMKATQSLGFVLSEPLMLGSLGDDAVDAAVASTPTDFASALSQAPIADVAMPTANYAADNSTSSNSWFSGLADGLTGVLNSSGFSSALSMLTPFVNTAAQKDALSLQLTQLKNGLPLYRPATVLPGGVLASNTITTLTNNMPLILGGIGLIVLVSMMSKSS